MELLKCFGSLLKKDSQNLPTTGSRKISDLVDDDVYIEGEDHQQIEYSEAGSSNASNESIKPQQLWNNAKILEDELPKDDLIDERPTSEYLDNKVEMTESVLVEKIALEIFSNSELLHKLKTNVANKLLEKFNYCEMPNIEDKYKTRTVKFLERFEALLKEEFDDFRQTN